MKVSPTPLLVSYPAPQSETAADKTVLVANSGKRALTLNRYRNGQVEVLLSRPPATQLVASGGGAKGVAYSGVVQALEERNALRDIQTVSGSSAGAIYGALLASGMGAERFDLLSDNLELPTLLNSDKTWVRALQNAYTDVGRMVGRLPAPVGDVLQALYTLLPRLQSNAQPLERLIRDESRQAVLERIAELPRDARSTSTMAIADRLSAGGATTFADLEALSRQIPAIKPLNITGTAMFAGRPQLVVFNASLTPDMDIARAAHISAALPILFKSPQERGHGFQEQGEKTAFQDGGVLLNTPVADLYQRQPHGNTVTDVERLILRLDDVTVPKPGAGLMDAVADAVTGTAHTANGELMHARLKPFADQTVSLPFNTELGDFRSALKGTLNFSMSQDVKNHLQKRAFDAVSEHLDKRENVREQYMFDSVHSAILALDDETLASAAPDLAKDEACKPVLRFRHEARQVLAALDSAISASNQGDRLELSAALGSALRNLDGLADRPESLDWLATQLNAPGNANFQQLLQSTHGHMSKVLRSGMAEMKRRDVAAAADNLVREVIYPSLFRYGQSDANATLLRDAVRDLERATTPAEVNQVLDNIINNYQARNKPWGKPFSSTTVEMAKTWRLPV